MFFVFEMWVGGIYFSPPFLTNKDETFFLPFRIITYNVPIICVRWGVTPPQLI